MMQILLYRVVRLGLCSAAVVFLSSSQWINLLKISLSILYHIVYMHRFIMLMLLLLLPGNCRLLPPSLRKGTKRRQNGKRPAEKKTDDIATFCNKECKLAFISIHT